MHEFKVTIQEDNGKVFEHVIKRDCVNHDEIRDSVREQLGEEDTIISIVPVLKLI